MRMTERAEKILKKPLGTLIEGTPEQTMKTFTKLRTGNVICIGDVIFAECARAGIEVEQAIFDGTTLRKKLLNIPPHDIVVNNPKSHITEALLDAIRHGYRRILVCGEEDLATLPAVLYASEGSQVLYGQPGVGLVVIEVNTESKSKMRTLMEMFEEDTNED